MSFKDKANSDLQSFFNTNEFSDVVIIDGQSQNVMVDNERLKKRAGEFEGITTGMILYFIPVSAFPKPHIGDTQFFDNRLYHIEDVKEDQGIYEIIISQNRGE